jgi:antitoxin (DNA-binding transcriptional repressor) of toxin-antitoxin stability system
MNEVNQKHHEIVITKQGKPIAKLVPYTQARKGLFGAMEGSITILEDIVEPTGETWEADAE